jgi:hypothetical protein
MHQISTLDALLFILKQVPSAWSSNNLGPWVEFGPTRFTFLEYLLIGLASSAFGEVLLNREGRNRA